LPKGIAAYAGYAKDGTPLYVGACCRGELSELASHIYWWWESYKRPTPETPLWRFMDFAKFVSLVADKALYFSRVDQLGDPFEGARGIASKESEWREHSLEYLREALRTIPGDQPQMPQEKIEEEVERLHREITEIGTREVRHTYVTCWHENEGESEALWRLYCPPQSAGVAISTNFSSLDSALESEFHIIFGHVQYIDFSKGFAGTYDRVFWKRKSLSHEVEVRGVFKSHWTDKADKAGILVPVNLSRLIQKVVISPFAPSWFESVLRETLRKYELEVPVYKSELLAAPFF
jgi:hypothetical protein